MRPMPMMPPREVEPCCMTSLARIEAAAGRVQSGQRGTPAVFFVGFAGDGEHPIFKREAVFAQSVFADHFGSADRSIELINDVDDRDSFPLATVSGLSDTLKLLTQRMDLEQDVLVVMLTSHGSREGIEVKATASYPCCNSGPSNCARRSMSRASSGSVGRGVRVLFRCVYRPAEIGFHHGRYVHPMPTILPLMR